MINAPSDFHAEIIDAVAEGNKVWVFSKVKGYPGGAEKDTVDMMTFTDEGKLLWTKDVQRVAETEGVKRVVETKAMRASS